MFMSGPSFCIIERKQIGLQVVSVRSPIWFQDTDAVFMD